MQRLSWAAVARRIAGAITICGFLALAGGCNTVAGAGEDLQEASEETEEAIDDAFDDRR